MRRANGFAMLPRWRAGPLGMVLAEVDRENGRRYERGMSPFALGLIVVALAYLIGSIPFGYLCGRLVGRLDIRQHGSGNVGATNVGRVLGWKWGVLVFALDLLKGFAPVFWLAPQVFGDLPAAIHWSVAAGLAAILGHMFPCWLGFNAGKGVATALGVVLCLGGWSTAIAAAVFVASFALWRYVSLSSIVAAVAFGVSQLVRLWPTPFSEESWSLAGFSLLVPLLIILRHRANIGRLLKGEEPQYRFRKTAPNAAAVESHSEMPRSDDPSAGDSARRASGAPQIGESPGRS